MRLVQTLAWLAVAIALLHLILSSTRAPATDLRGWFAIGAFAALLLASLTWAASDRTRSISAVAGVATSLLALALIAVRAAHETGVVMLLGGALNAAPILASLWSGFSSSRPPDRHNP